MLGTASSPIPRGVSLMVLHVNEMHTDVRSFDAPEHARIGHPAADPDHRTPDEIWRECRGRTEWLCRRTAAEGFDD
jgi:hypothetical protein